MYPSSDTETRTERKNTKGKGRREGSWKHMIAIGRVPNCRSTLTHSHHHPMMYNTITGQVAVTDINKHQADELGTTIQKDFIHCVTSGRDPQRNLVQWEGHEEQKAQTATVNDIPVFDVYDCFARQLIVGQKREISIAQPSVAHQRRLSSQV